jgi:hypothetical protein
MIDKRLSAERRVPPFAHKFAERVDSGEAVAIRQQLGEKVHNLDSAIVIAWSIINCHVMFP